MELNWSTYLLEIVNFMVLVWILKRYLYQPVLDVIARRRQAIEQTTGAADAARRQAEELKNQFEGRLADWAQEKQKARQALQGELDELRRQRLADLEAQLAAASERARVRDERRVEAAFAAREHDALVLATRFASRLLGRVAGPALEAALAKVALEDLRSLAPDRREAVRRALEASPGLRVLSAFPLGDSGQEAVRSALTELAGRPVDCNFAEDPSLVAGLRIVAGPWVLRANIKDDLEGFAGAVQDGRQG